MPTSSRVARRFYLAVYRCNTSANSRTCRRALSTSTGHSFSAQNGNRAEGGARRADEGPQLFSYHDDRSLTHSGRPTDRPIAPTDRSPTHSGRPMKHQPKRQDDRPIAPSWRQEPVRTVLERPFHTLQPWEHVCRYRTESGILLQVAVPQYILAKIERKDDKYFHRLQQSSGARIELGATSENHTIQLVSVTLSGTYREVATAFEKIKTQHEPLWQLQPPKSIDELPSSAMLPLTPVTREADEDYRKIEVLIPMIKWPAYRGLFARDPQRLHRSTLALGPIVEHDDQETVGLRASRFQSVLLSGPTKSVNHAVSKLIADLKRDQRSFLKLAPAARSNASVTEKNDGVALATGLNASVTEKDDGVAPEEVPAVLKYPHYMRLLLPHEPDGDNSATVHVLARTISHFDVKMVARQPRNGGTAIMLSGSSSETLRNVKDHVQENLNKAGEANESRPLLVEELPIRLDPAQMDLAQQAQPAPGTLPRMDEVLKSALRSLPHSVVVVTSRMKASRDTMSNIRTEEDLVRLFRGVTVSSFNTVTLAPTPIVSFNLRMPSGSWEAISSSKVMQIHLLNATPHGAALAHLFTQQYERPEEPMEKIRGLADIHTWQIKSVPPAIQHPGVSTWIKAKLLRDKCVQVGDHVIVVAQVGEVVHGNETFPAEGSSGLAYAKRGYRSVGEEIPALDIADDGLNEALSSVQDLTSELRRRRAEKKREAMAASLPDEGVDEIDGEKEVDSLDERFDEHSAHQTAVDYFARDEEEEPTAQDHEARSVEDDGSQQRSEDAAVSEAAVPKDADVQPKQQPRD